MVRKKFLYMDNVLCMVCVVLHEHLFSQHPYTYFLFCSFTFCIFPLLCFILFFTGTDLNVVIVSIYYLRPKRSLGFFFFVLLSHIPVHYNRTFILVTLKHYPNLHLYSISLRKFFIYYRKIIISLNDSN